MLTHDVGLINPLHYDEIVNTVSRKNTTHLKNLDMTREVTNRFLMKWLRNPLSGESLETYVNAHYPGILETLFNDLRKECHQYCLLRTKDPDLSEDISHGVMYQLLVSPNSVSDIGSWVKQATHNLLCKHYKMK